MEMYLKILGNTAFHVSPDALKPKFHSMGEMQSILNRERARSDRNGNSFSVIIFELPEENRSEMNHDIIDKIMGRLRRTDEVGLLSRKHIGVIMPDTSEPGSLAVAQAIESTLNGSAINLRVSIATYPSRKWEEQVLFHDAITQD